MDKNNSNSQNNCKIIHISEDNLSYDSNLSKSSRDNIYNKDAFLYSWGKNKYGELGIGTLTNAYKPSPILSLEFQSIHSIKSGGRNAIILSSDGYIYLCGSNIFGLLALNNNIQNNEHYQKYFKKINYFIENQIIIKEVSIAEFHCLALSQNGRVFGWGGNLFNKLGRKYDILQGIPTQILIKNKIKSISCGDYHSCALSEEGILFSWGGGGESYNKGQCGHGTTKDVQKPKKVEFFIKNNIKIIKVCCGGYHTIVMSETNDLFSFGKGIYGQCGYGQPENTSLPKKVYFNENQNIKYENNKKINIIDIKCGGEHSLFLSSNNNVYTCGHGYLGQLGLGNNKNINLPLIVQSLTNKKIIQIAAGWSHSLVLTSEGNIYSTGCNKYGELGIGKDFNKYNYTWIKCLSNLNIKNISAGGHHSWCLIDSYKPLRDDNNNPEPLLKSNFSMIKKNKRKLTETSNFSNNNSSLLNENRWNKLNNNHSKSGISADNTIRRKKINSEGEDFDINQKRNNSQRKIKNLIDNYNNNENDMNLDKLIESINNLDNYEYSTDKKENNQDDNDDNNDNNNEKYFPDLNNNNNKNNINNLEENENDNFEVSNKINNKNYYNNNDNNDKDDNDDNDNNDYSNKENYSQNNYIKNNSNINLNDDKFNDNNNDEDEDENNDRFIYNNYNEKNNIRKSINYICELKILYCDLNLSHRFIRFQTPIEYNKLYQIIKNNYIDKDIGNISFQFQRDDEIENNNSITPEINFIFNKMKNENLINLDELSKTYTLGIVYDYNKNETINKYKEKNVLNDINDSESEGPFFGVKTLNYKQIISSKNENILSYWIIDFCKVYNDLIEENNNKNIISKFSFFELRPKIFKSFEI